jgi:hypothetical protein
MAMVLFSSLSRLELVLARGKMGREPHERATDPDGFKGTHAIVAPLDQYFLPRALTASEKPYLVTAEMLAQSLPPAKRAWAA